MRWWIKIGLLKQRYGVDTNTLKKATNKQANKEQKQNSQVSLINEIGG